MEPDSVIVTPKPPSRSKFFLFSLFFLACLILLVEGVYYWRLVKKTPTPEVAPQPSEEIAQPYSGEMIATEKIDIFLSPGERKVGYFVPGQKFTPSGEQEGNWVQVIDSGGYELWIEEDSAYEPAEK